MDKINHQNVHFEQIAEEYYQARLDKKHLLFKGLLMGHMLSSVSKHIKATFMGRRCAVLEPMCGDGAGAGIIRDYVYENIEYEGFDYNDTLIKKHEELLPHTLIYKMDVTQFHTDKKYDIVILIGGLHHVHDVAGDIVQKIGEVLNPGGVFINFEPTHNNSLIGKIRDIIYEKSNYFDDKSEHDFSLEELNYMYQKAGLKIFEQFYPGLLGYILWFNPDAFPCLNIGTKNFVKYFFSVEKMLYKSKIGKCFSFTTFSVLIKGM